MGVYCPPSNVNYKNNNNPYLPYLDSHTNIQKDSSLSIFID